MNDTYDDLPLELIKKIIRYLRPTSFLHLRLSWFLKLKLLSKHHQMLINEIMTRPAYVIHIISKAIPTTVGLRFINYYRLTPAYTALKEKYHSEPKSLLLAERICYAMTTEDVTGITLKQLEQDKSKITDDDVLFYLNTMIFAIKSKPHDCIPGFTYLNPVRFHLFKKFLNLMNVNMRNAYLQNADLTTVRMKGINLSLSDLSYANLEGVDLEDANLAQANLIKTNLKNTNLKNVNLHEARFITEKVGQLTEELDYLFLFVKDHPQQHELKRAIAADIINITERLRYLPYKAVELIQIAKQHPLFSRSLSNRLKKAVVSLLWKPPPTTSSGLEVLEIYERELLLKIRDVRIGVQVGRLSIK